MQKIIDIDPKPVQNVNVMVKAMRIRMYMSQTNVVKA